MKFNTVTIKNIVLKRQIWLWVIFGLSVLFLLSFLTWLVLVALQNGTHMSTFAANGTFQLYNPMRRLMLGQAIGYDFPFFHGIGIPLLHYPVFTLLGGGVFAAETAKWVVSPLLFLSSALFFFYAYFRDFKKSIVAVALLTVISLSWVDVVWPGNSLIGARGTFPVLIIGALLWKTSRIIRIKSFTISANEFVALVLLGISLLFGVEQGAAAILAYAFVHFVIIFRHQKKKRIVNIYHLALKGVFILFVAFVAFTIATKGHPLSAIQYAFIDIPTDQGWYFGTEITGYLTWSNLFPLLFPFNMRYMWLIILGGAVSLFLLLRISNQQHLRLPLLYALTYGIVAFLITISGYYSPSSQLIPLERVMSLVLIAAFVSFAFSSRVWGWAPPTSNQRHIKIVGLVAVLVISLCALTNVTYIKVSAIKNDFSAREELKLANEARHASDYFAASPSWKQSIDAFRPYIDPNKTIWSMYTSVYDTTFGDQLSPSRGGEDYIIHALGDTRRAAYEADFLDLKPHYVLTLKPSYFDYEGWLWQNHWNIYKQIFTHYTLVAENPSNYLWEINSTYEQNVNAPKNAVTTDNSITLPANDTSKPIVYTVTVQYSANSAIPATGRMSRYFIQINTSYDTQRRKISLPSHKTTWSFPVLLIPGENSVQLSAVADGIVPFANLSIKKATYAEVPIDSQNMKPFENNICFINSKKQPLADYPWACDSETYEMSYR